MHSFHLIVRGVYLSQQMKMSDIFTFRLTANKLIIHQSFITTSEPLPLWNFVPCAVYANFLDLFQIKSAHQTVIELFLTGLLFWNISRNLLWKTKPLRKMAHRMCASEISLSNNSLLIHVITVYSLSEVEKGGNFSKQTLYFSFISFTQKSCLNECYRQWLWKSNCNTFCSSLHILLTRSQIFL